MNKKEIKQLLDAFYKGTSTEEEEAQLKQFFLSTEDMPDEFEADRKCFQALHQANDIPLPEGLSERLETQIHEHATKEKKNVVRKYLYRVGSAAAVVLLCVGLYVYEIKPQEPPLADTYTDPVEAAFAAYKALAFMSTQINVGLQQVSEATQEIQKANEIVYKQLKD